MQCIIKVFKKVTNVRVNSRPGETYPCIGAVFKPVLSMPGDRNIWLSTPYNKHGGCARTRLAYSLPWDICCPCPCPVCAVAHHDYNHVRGHFNIGTSFRLSVIQFFVIIYVLMASRYFRHNIF